MVVVVEQDCNCIYNSTMLVWITQQRTKDLKINYVPLGSVHIGVWVYAQKVLLVVVKKTLTMIRMEFINIFRHRRNKVGVIRSSCQNQCEDLKDS